MQFCGASSHHDNERRAPLRTPYAGILKYVWIFYAEIAHVSNTDIPFVQLFEDAMKSTLLFRRRDVADRKTQSKWERPYELIGLIVAILAVATFLFIANVIFNAR
jgi:hypothetical protein